MRAVFQEPRHDPVGIFKPGSSNKHLLDIFKIIYQVVIDYDDTILTCSKKQTSRFREVLKQELRGEKVQIYSTKIQHIILLRLEEWKNREDSSINITQESSYLATSIIAQLFLGFEKVLITIFITLFTP
jgi:cytochrome P450